MLIHPNIMNGQINVDSFENSYFAKFVQMKNI